MPQRSTAITSSFATANGSASTGPIGDVSTGPIASSASTGPIDEDGSTGPILSSASTGPIEDDGSTGPIKRVHRNDLTSTCMAETESLGPIATETLEPRWAATRQQ